MSVYRSDHPGRSVELRGITLRLLLQLFRNIVRDTLDLAGRDSGRFGHRLLPARLFRTSGGRYAGRVDRGDRRHDRRIFRRIFRRRIGRRHPRPFLGAVIGEFIENDIPYPYIKGEIAAFEVEGQTGEAEINKNNRTIVVSVGDEVDIEELRITKFVVNDEATFNTEEQYCVSPAKFPSTGFSSLADLPAGADTRVDFTKTVPFLLRTYQDYRDNYGDRKPSNVRLRWKMALPAIIDDRIIRYWCMFLRNGLIGG